MRGWPRKRLMPYRTTSAPERRERAYMDAVLRGDFLEADDLFAGLSSPIRIDAGRTPPLSIETRASLIDRLLTHVGGEGAKGPWRVCHGGSVLLYGFDEYLVLDPALPPAEIALLVEQGIIDR